jgi:hypothetical protein
MSNDIEETFKQIILSYVPSDENKNKQDKIEEIKISKEVSCTLERAREIRIIREYNNSLFPNIKYIPKNITIKKEDFTPEQQRFFENYIIEIKRLYN